MSAPDSHSLEETFARAARHVQRLHLIFIGATLVYVGAAFALKLLAFMPQESGFILASDERMSLLLALVFMVVAIALAGTVAFALAPSRLRVSVEGRETEEVFQAIVQRSIIVIAVSDLIAVLGLIHFLVAGRLDILGALVTAGIILLFYTMPNEEKWRNAASRS
nr:hypothetical protein [Ardenticatena sp.]